MDTVRGHRDRASTGSVLVQVALLGVTSVVIQFFVLTIAHRVAGSLLITAGVSVALQGSRRTA